MSDNQHDLKAIHDRLQRLETNVDGAMKRLRMVETSDAVQQSELESIKLILEGSKIKIDRIHDLVTEQKGGFKWSTGILGLIATGLGIYIALEKINGGQ